MARNTSPRRGFTLVELLVVIGIIALLIGILMPALSKAKYHAGLVKCASNLHQIGLACNIYRSNFKDHFCLWQGPPPLPSGYAPHNLTTPYAYTAGTSSYMESTNWWSWGNTPKMLRRVGWQSGTYGSNFGPMCYVREGYLKDTRVLYCPLDTFRTPMPGDYKLIYNLAGPASDYIKVTNLYIDNNTFGAPGVTGGVVTSYDFNPLQTTRASRIQQSRVDANYQNGTYPFNGMNPNDAPLAMDLLQSKLDDFATGVGGQSHPGDWNVLRFDGSVKKVYSQALLKRQAKFAVLTPTSNSWSEYEIELQNFIVGK